MYTTFTVDTTLGKERLTQLLAAADPSARVTEYGHIWVVDLSNRTNHERLDAADPSVLTTMLWDMLHDAADWVPDPVEMADQHTAMLKLYQQFLGPVPWDHPYRAPTAAIEDSARLAFALDHDLVGKALDDKAAADLLRPGMTAHDLYRNGVTPLLHDAILGTRVGKALAFGALAETYQGTLDIGWDITCTINGEDQPSGNGALSRAALDALT